MINRSFRILCKGIHGRLFSGRGSLEFMRPEKPLNECPKSKEEFVRNLIYNFTSPALASSLFEKEMTLRKCAHLLDSKDFEELRLLLRPFMNLIEENVNPRLQLHQTITSMYLEEIRTILSRIPREVQVHTPKRASVLVPLCLDTLDRPALLFTQRSSTLSHHSSEVCFPGGMREPEDSHITETALREMMEEIGIPSSAVTVLGILRCDWGQIRTLVGVGVTPVIGFIGSLQRVQMVINPQEVAFTFTQTLEDLCNSDHWSVRDYSAPVYSHDDHVIWGLTGYITNRFINNVVSKINIAGRG